MLKKLSFNRAAMLGIAALSLFAAPAMYAGPITFTAAGALVDGATLSGTVVIDTAAGVVVSTNLNVSSPISLSGLAWASAVGGQGTSEYTLVATPGGIISGDDVGLELVTTTLVGYTGGSLCVSSCSGGVGAINSFAQNADNGTFSFFNSATLTATPEPASVVLVGSAMLGLLALRRRIAR